MSEGRREGGREGGSGAESILHSGQIGVKGELQRRRGPFLRSFEREEEEGVVGGERASGANFHPQLENRTEASVRPSLRPSVRRVGGELSNLEARAILQMHNGMAPPRFSVSGTAVSAVSRSSSPSVRRDKKSRDPRVTLN